MRGQLLLISLLTLSIMTPAQSQSPATSALESRTSESRIPDSRISTMKTLSFRLRPGQDLKEELDKLVQQQHIEAGAVLTCVGSFLPT